MNKFSEQLEQAVRSNGQRRSISSDTFCNLEVDSPILQLSKPELKGPREELAEERRQVASRTRTLTSMRVEKHLINLLDPLSFEAEQYRKLCYLIERFHKTVGLSVIAISSAAAGDGKTTTAINLAAELAKTSGMRVLLMDFDLRRPSVAAYLGESEENHPGILDLIRESHLITLDDIAVGVTVNLSPINLSILFAGQAMATTYEMPESWQIEGMFDSARRKYEYVIVDTPPIFRFPDCQLLEQFVDGFLLVIAKHKTPRELLSEAVNTLDPNKVIGMILNNSEKKRIAGYYGYSTYYQYEYRRIRKEHGNVMRRLMQNCQSIFRGAKRK
jgi:protein-tyrosine kinase